MVEESGQNWGAGVWIYLETLHAREVNDRSNNSSDMPTGYVYYVAGATNDEKDLQDLLNQRGEMPFPAESWNADWTLDYQPPAEATQNTGWRFVTLTNMVLVFCRIDGIIRHRIRSVAGRLMFILLWQIAMTASVLLLPGHLPALVTAHVIIGLGLTAPAAANFALYQGITGRGTFINLFIYLAIMALTPYIATIHLQQLDTLMVQIPEPYQLLTTVTLVLIVPASIFLLPLLKIFRGNTQ